MNTDPLFDFVMKNMDDRQKRHLACFFAERYEEFHRRMRALTNTLYYDEEIKRGKIIDKALRVAHNFANGKSSRYELRLAAHIAKQLRDDEEKKDPHPVEYACHPLAQVAWINNRSAVLGAAAAYEQVVGNDWSMGWKMEERRLLDFTKEMARTRCSSICVENKPERFVSSSLRRKKSWK